MRIRVIKEGWRGRKIGDTGEVLDEIGKKLIADGYVEEFFGLNRELAAIRETKIETDIPVSVPGQLDNNLNESDNGNDGDH